MNVQNANKNAYFEYTCGEVKTKCVKKFSTSKVQEDFGLALTSNKLCEKEIIP